MTTDSRPSHDTKTKSDSLAFDAVEQEHIAAQPAPAYAGDILQRAKVSPTHLSSGDVMVLQRTIGNQATLRVLNRPPAPASTPSNGAPFSGIGQSVPGDIQRTVAPMSVTPEVTPKVVQSGHLARGVIQRESKNWDKFKDFNSRHGLGGWGEDQQWWVDEMNPANNEGAAKVGKPLAVAPFAALQMGLSGVGRGLTSLAGGAYYGAKGLGSYAKSGWGALKNTAKSTKKSSWDPNSDNQKGATLGETLPGTLGGITSISGGGANVVDKLAGINQIDVSPEMQQVDQTLHNFDGSKMDSVSSVGQGFGAATGLLGGIGGLANTFRGIGNIFGRKREGKGYQRLTRGVGRTGAGLAQTFAGTAVAGKSIANLAGVASPAASFLASAAIPAQAALSGIDLVKGTYGLKKATERKGNLRDLQKNFKDTDQSKSDFARLAKQYQSKRQVRAGANIAAGMMGGLGAGLVLGGVTAPVGLALLAGAGAIKGGAALWGKMRDRTWGKKNAKAKRAKEMDWAGQAAKNYKDKDIRAVLEAMGADENALDIEQLDQMDEEQRTRVMFNQLMKR